MRELGKALPCTRSGAKQFVSIAAAKRNREKQREAVKEILKNQDYLTVTSLIALGWDISVARRCLTEMAHDGQVLAEASGTWTKYTLKPESLLTRRWRIRNFPFDLSYSPRYY